MESLYPLAARIIQNATRDHPADAVLRSELKRARGLRPDASRFVARLVFAYYRWLGWLEPSSCSGVSSERGTLSSGQQRRSHETPLQGMLEAQVRQALVLQERFNRNPASFTEEEFRARAIPRWVEEHLSVTQGWLRCLQQEPVLWLRARPHHGPSLAQQLRDCVPVGAGPLQDCLRYAGEKDLFATREFQAGEFELQDLSSQLVGLICAPQPGETWWDACAGEGGKTLHLADLMNNQGLIWATDRAAWRLQRLKRRAARARVFNYRSALWSGGLPLPTRTRFDGVLVDAPCSGVGTWPRNPQARWTTSAADVRELSVLQQQLLLHAAKAMKPGGKLIYAVCTLTRSETVAVVEAFEKSCPDFAPWPVLNPLRPGVSAAAQHCFWPQEKGGNGMFVAVWRRADTLNKRFNLHHFAKS